MRGCWFSKLGIKLEEKKFILENKTQYTQQEQHYKCYIFCLIFMNRSLDVFVADHVGMEYESRNDPHCELRVVGEPFAKSEASTAVKKNNPLFIQVTEVLQRIKAKGPTYFI